MAVAVNKLVKRSDGCIESMPAAAVHIYAGTLAFRDSSGYATDTANSGANPFQGISFKECDNSAGGAGDLKAELYRDGVFDLIGSGFTQADVGKAVYATDNFTITLTPAVTAVFIGRVARYVSTTVVGVAIDPTGAIGAPAALTALTHTAPGTPDYAIQDLTTTTPYGFVTKDEGNTVLSKIVNLDLRVTALEAR